MNHYREDTEYKTKMDWILRYHNCIEEIKRVEERIETAMANACRISASLTGMPNGGGVSDKVGRAVENIDELKTQLYELREKADIYYNELLDAMAFLPEHEFRALLPRYAHKVRWIDVARCQGYEEGTVKAFHTKFINKFEIPEQHLIAL